MKKRLRRISLFLVVWIIISNFPVMAQTPDKSVLVGEECRIFDYIDKKAFEKANHIERVQEDEDLDTYVFKNGDGSKTVYYLDEAVKFIAADGSIREKNLKLVKSENGCTTTQNDVELILPDSISSGISIKYNSFSIRILPKAKDATKATLNNNSVYYKEAFGKGTSLNCTPSLSGVKEDIVLSTYTGIHEFSFEMETNGLLLYKDESHYYLAKEPDAEEKTILGDIEVYDSTGRPSMGHIDVDTLESGNRYLVTLSVDDDFLLNPETQYPVTIDTPVRISDNTHGSNSIEDAPVYQGYPTSNFGTYQYDRAGYAGSTYKTGRTAVRLTSLINSTRFRIVPASEILSAKFYIADASGTAGPMVYLKALTSNANWTERNVTWNNVGSYSSTTYASATPQYGRFAEFDITSLVRAWKNGIQNRHCGFILIGANEGTTDKSLYSCEHSTSGQRPYVEVTYKERKAIVIVPGFEGSYLYDTRTHIAWLGGDTHNVFLNYGDVQLADGSHLIAGDISNFACDESGESISDYVEAGLITNSGVQIVPNVYKTLFDELTSSFGGSYYVEFFAYDWRLSCATAAMKLEDMNSYYDRLIMIGHSMGGLVVSSYLARSQSNRDRVDKFIAIATPFNGAPIALSMLEGDYPSSDLWDIGTAGQNFPSLYELLPTETYFQGNGGYVIISNSSNPISGYANTQQYLKNLNWARHNGQVKPLFSSAESFHYSLCVDGEIVTNRSDVDMYILYGDDRETPVYVTYSTGNSPTTQNSTVGDGVVPSSSVLYGYSQDILNVHVYHTMTHNNLIYSGNSIADLESIISD